MPKAADPDPIKFFSSYLKITGVAHTSPETEGDPALIGTRLGIINGSHWVSMWSSYFGAQFLPGTHLITIGNEAVQINFMEAYARGEAVPPSSNIQAFIRYAEDLVQLGRVDAILITCSTMNRAYNAVAQAMLAHGVPVMQIDAPMMQQAVRYGGKILVIATHGPTVQSTQALLRESAAAAGAMVSFAGVTVEEAWYRLAEGDVEGHNQLLAAAIRHEVSADSDIRCVVLAQLSMTVFLLSYPDPLAAFGVPVLTSGQSGFEAVRELLTHEAP